MITLNNDEVIRIIKETLNTDKIYACWIFGSYGTEEFNEFSDIDIAVITDLNFCELGEYQDILEDKLGIEVDLVNVYSVFKIIQLQITSSGNLLFYTDEDKLDKFLAKVDYWYKTDFRIWKANYEEDY